MATEVTAAVQSTEEKTRKLFSNLRAYFDPKYVKFKPAVVQGNRALAFAYVDVRVVMARLDSVLGPENWQDEYTFLADGSCLCKLSLRINGEWLAKMDVGAPSEQPDGGDRDKASCSDALKRAAVKWGVSRYLYRLPSQWVDYDPQRRQFVRQPTLPDWAVPVAKEVTDSRDQSKTIVPPKAAETRVETSPLPTAALVTTASVVPQQPCHKVSLSEDEVDSLVVGIRGCGWTLASVEEWFREKLSIPVMGAPLTDVKQLTRQQATLLRKAIADEEAKIPF